jgi:hypothetical protein
MTEGIGWIVDAEVSGDFDSREKTLLRDTLRTRVNDGRILRLIGKWLHAGVMEKGVLTHPEPGVPQGGVVSPGRAHRCRHHGRDAWFEREVRPRMQGRCFLMRFADDCVMGGELATDAGRIMAVLPKRFARCGLRLPPTKTTLGACRKPGARQETEDEHGPFDFLGLPHSWTKSRRGCWGIKRQTAGKRRRRTKKALGRWCRSTRHAPVKDQYQMLCLKVRGHFPYDGLRGHCRMLEGSARYAEKAWRYGLSRRSSKSSIGWEKFQKLLGGYPLPIPKIVHNICASLQGSTVMRQSGADTLVTEEP